MGCELSRGEDFLDVQLAATGLTPSELEWLYKVYSSFRFKKRDTIDIKGLLLAWECDTNELCRKALMLFDRVRNTNRMNFKEFVFVIWHFSILSQYSMGIFLLEAFDESSVAIFENAALLKCLHALKVPDVYVNIALHDSPEANLYKEGERTFDIDEWEAFCAKYPTFLATAMECQNKIREKCLGKAFWESIQNRIAVFSLKDDMITGVTMTQYIDLYIKNYLRENVRRMHDREWPCCAMNIVIDAHKEALENGKVDKWLAYQSQAFTQQSLTIQGSNGPDGQSTINDTQIISQSKDNGQGQHQQGKAADIVTVKLGVTSSPPSKQHHPGKVVPSPASATKVDLLEGDADLNGAVDVTVHIKHGSLHSSPSVRHGHHHREKESSLNQQTQQHQDQQNNHLSNEPNNKSAHHRKHSIEGSVGDSLRQSHDSGDHEDNTAPTPAGDVVGSMNTDNLTKEMSIAYALALSSGEPIDFRKHKPLPPIGGTVSAPGTGGHSTTRMHRRHSEERGIVQPLELVHASVVVHDKIRHELPSAAGLGHGVSHSKHGEGNHSKHDERKHGEGNHSKHDEQKHGEENHSKHDDGNHSKHGEVSHRKHGDGKKSTTRRKSL